MSRFAKLTLSALFLSQFLFAQFGSGIQGTVVDRTAAVVPDVRITVLNVDTGVSRETVTSEVGVYRMPSLGAGTYKITATKSGFGSAEQDAVNRVSFHLCFRPPTVALREAQSRS